MCSNAMMRSYDMKFVVSPEAQNRKYLENKTLFFPKINSFIIINGYAMANK